MIRFFNHLKLNLSERESASIVPRASSAPCFPIVGKPEHNSLVSVCFLPAFTSIYPLSSITQWSRRVNFTQNLPVTDTVKLRVECALGCTNNSGNRITRQIRDLMASWNIQRFRTHADFGHLTEIMTQNPILIKALKSGEIRGLSTHIELIVSVVTVSPRVSASPQ